MAEEKQTEVTQEETVETPPEVSVDELKQAISAKDAEILGLQQTVSKHADNEHKLKDQANSLATIHGRLDKQEENQAAILDYLEEIRGEPVEQPGTSKVSHRAQLAESRKQEGSNKEAVKADPDVVKFVNYMDSQGFSTDDALVKEAVGEDRSPKDALKYLREKVEAGRGENVEKRAKEIAQGLIEQKLKELGLTTEATAVPSASAKDLSGTPMELAARAYSEKK